ncbi:MAG: hypothetical protein PHQ36_07615 [Anaerolineales bacterium]|nr:hypothetical protein [Anaerolineales bacterium]
MPRFKNIINIFTKVFSYPWYPLVISAYPALALLSSNAGQVQRSAGIRPLLASVLFGGFVFFTLWLFFRQAHKAAFLSALWIGLFFSFGHAYMYLKDEYPKADYAPRLLICWGILFALALLWATRPRLTFVSAAPTINTISAALILMAVWQSASSVGLRRASALGADNAPIQNDLRAPANPPDVYYFILDSYARADTLKMAYNYDNMEFLNALRERGFYVAECSQSNYPRTDVSVAAALNMTYLQDLDSEFTPDSTARNTLWNSLKHSAARYNFERMGYQTVNFATGFAWNELDDADVYITPPPITSGMTEFEGLFLDTTLARYINDWGWVNPDAVMGQSFRDRFNSIFDNMDKLAGAPAPQFAYIHVISPHPPFVFDADGNYTNPADFWDERKLYPYDLYEKGYTSQTTHLNQKMLSAIDTILKKSKTPPIIVVQGDHGPWMQPHDRLMWILNAYYLPNHNDKLYKTITPVNTFRIIFNEYFGGKYDLLDDASYYSPVPKIYDFSLIPNKCK